MDVNDLRALWTLLSFVVFVAIAAWAYSGRRTAQFERAARSPLDEEA